MKHLKILLIGLMAILLAACGGGSGGSLFGEDGSSGGDGSDGGTNGGETSALSNNTYFPLNLYYSGEGYVKDDKIDFFLLSPFTMTYLVSPVDAKTLEPAKNPKISDFELKINDENPEVSEQEPIFQKVEGLPINLHTALVIDASGSSQSIDKDKLKAAIKAFVLKAQDHENTIIKNQVFSLWVFGENVVYLHDKFTKDINDIETALNSIQWTSYGYGSAVYQAIVAAVGYYEGKGSNELSKELNYKYKDPKDNTSLESEIMLIDGYTGTIDPALLPDLIMIEDIYEFNLSNVVLFASGGQSHYAFNKEAAQTALNWQSFLVFDEDNNEGSNDSQNEGGDKLSAMDGMVHSGKPLYYVAIGDGPVIKEIKELATLTIDNTKTSAFSFADKLIAQQVNDLKKRSRADNIYILRFPLFERDGTTKSSFASKTNVRDYTLSFEWKYLADAENIIPKHGAKLEITGANDEYFAGARVSVSKYSKLYPAARWDVWNNHQSGHVWTVDGTVRPAAADRSITITTADVGKVVSLSNGGLSTSLQIVP